MGLFRKKAPQALDIKVVKVGDVIIIGSAVYMVHGDHIRQLAVKPPKAPEAN